MSMKKVISIVAVFFMLCTGVYAGIEPVISINGASGSVGVNSDTPLTLSVKLSPGEKDGANADWWLLAFGVGRWFFYQADGGWTDLGEKFDIEKLRPAYQGRLFSMEPTDLGQLPKLNAGNYSFYFGVDLKRNGKLDGDLLVSKSLNLTISESGKRSDFVTANNGYLSGPYGGVTSGSVILAPTAVEDKSIEVTRAIEEADMIKVEGSYLYILNRYKGLTICDISQPDAPFIAGRASVVGNPTEMYIRDNRAYIILSADYQVFYDFMPLIGGTTTTGSSSQISRIQVVDISSKTAPKLAGSFDLKGNVTDSRIVGDILYAVSSEQPYYWYYASDGGTDNQRNVYIVSINIADENNIREADRKDFGGSARYIHVTDKAIFIASGTQYYADSNSTITYVDIADPNGKIVKRGSINLAGSVNDKFKMDYFEGYFRVCTYQWIPTDSNMSWIGKGISNLFVIDAKNPDQLTQMGSVNLGEGEQLFATRFDGKRAYMVTYLRKDPLWVIDLSDPTKPAVKGELVVPGWSTHIEPKGDRLIALGVDDTSGSKVAVSLFDVANPEKPALLDKVIFGDQTGGWSSSSAHNDVKAFTILDDMGLILLPYNISTNDEKGNYKYDTRLQLIDYSASKLNARGWVSQKGEVLRSRSASNRLFSVSDNQVQVIDATNRDNPKVTAQLTLALNITDFKPLQNGYGIQIVETNGQYTLRAVPLSDPENGKAASEMTLEDTSYSSSFVNGNMIYLVSYVYDYSSSSLISYRPYTGKTKIQIIDFSKPESPQKRGNIEVEGNYYSMMTGVMSLYPYYSQGQLLQMNGSTLILSYSAGYYGPYYAYDSNGKVLPAEEQVKPKNGFKIIDLSDPDKPKLAYDFAFKTEAGITGYFLNGKTLYFSHSEVIEQDVKNRPQSKYYLGSINLSDIYAPVQNPSINIPGTCIGVDAAGTHAYTVNTEWNGVYDWSQSYTLNIVKLENDKAYLMSEAKLDGYMSGAVISDGFAYMGNNGITVADLRTPDKLVVYPGNSKDGGASILGVKNHKVFASVSGGVACYDASNPASLKLDELKTYYGYYIEFSDTAAYLPLGYYGVWVKNLNN